MTSLVIRTKASGGERSKKHSLEVIEAPPRPASEKVPLPGYFANYFKITVEPKVCWRYEIKVKLKGTSSNHEGPTGYKRRFLIEKALEKFASPNCYVSDLRDVLVSTKKIDETKLPYEISDENVPPKAYTIALSTPKEVNIGGIAKALETVFDDWKKSLCNADKPIDAYQGPLDTLEILGIILSYQSRVDNDLTTIGRSRFFDSDKESSWKKFLNEEDRILRIMRGFSHSVRPGDGHFLLNVNSSYGVFYPTAKISELIIASPLLKNLWKGDGYYRNLQSRLAGARVEYNIAGKSIFKTIKGLGKSPRKQLFILREERDNNGNPKVIPGRLGNEFREKSDSNNEWEISVYQYFELREYLANQS